MPPVYDWWFLTKFKMPKIKIAPSILSVLPKVTSEASILSADLSKINREIKEVEKYAGLVHVDVMDCIFVPQTTISSDFVKTIKTKVPLDVHLMAAFILFFLMNSICFEGSLQASSWIVME